MILSHKKIFPIGAFCGLSTNEVAFRSYYGILDSWGLTKVEEEIIKQFNLMLVHPRNKRYIFSLTGQVIISIFYGKYRNIYKNK